MSDDSKKIYALSNIKHDGKSYVRGDLVPVKGSQLERLLAIGVVSTKAVKDETEEEDEANDSEDQYDKMDGSALKEELTKRELGVSGKVDELRIRLREDDEKEEEDED